MFLFDFMFSIITYFLINDRSSPDILQFFKIFLYLAYHFFGFFPADLFLVKILIFFINSLKWICSFIKVDPYRIDELAVAMGQIASDDELRERLRKTGLEHVQKYTWHNAAVTMKALYERLLR